MLKDHDEWLKTEAVLGKIVVQWGHAMSLVYSLPEEMGFENFAAIRLGLAQLNGDGHRLSYMRRLIEHEPKLFDDPQHRDQEALQALKALEKLVPQRDALIHGIPVLSYKRDTKTKERIREGAYMLQQREWNESTRFIKVPETALKHLEKLGTAHDSLSRVATPMLFETWRSMLDFLQSNPTIRSE
ncbi:MULTISPECIES: hypothetical protein [unclassified Sinorhizobium]|uniref:hypothetical protein n=1 Tax=unclassified Sinorhizobium TaxID=2613772 RepID=UPI0024C40CA5|nr:MULTISPECIES: hypothetical protein [unclassified Sinorhizobium]MDK1377077.1 hypothetical protein [Sinorhizobium sp. 6-70]MDK1479628.1 hypothetical protein [Sinorhizobium sp. 6-117]